MLKRMQTAMPYILGSIIAVILMVVPEAKPLACGLSFPFAQSLIGK